MTGSASRSRTSRSACDTGKSVTTRSRARHPDQRNSAGPTNPIVITGFRMLPWLYDRMVGPLFQVAALTRRELAGTPGNVFKPTPDDEELHGRWPQSRP